jgi:hypothetical protein
MKHEMSFDNLIDQLRRGDGDGIGVRSDGQIVPAPPAPSGQHSSKLRPGESTSSAQPPHQGATPVTTVRKTVWGARS